MRFHVLGLPHTQTNKDFTACAYTQKVWKFCKMMQGRGHHIIHYGHEYSDPPADELVTVITHEKWKETYGDHDYKSKWFKFNTGDAAYKEFYRNAIREVGKRKQKNDFILPFWGHGHRPICDAHPDIINVEPGIGYSGGHWARWKIFESYALFHAYCGIAKVANCGPDNYDVVIPNYFDLDEFEFCDEKEDYLLYVGRVYDGKGVNIAIQVTEKLGIKLKIAGQLGDGYEDKNFPPHVEFIGYVNSEERKEVMKKAKASFLPSQYIEPFGGVQIENLLCGTPTITTDWGAFAENNIEGVTGYRCRTFGDYVKAVQKVWNGEIDYKECRKHGEKFSLEAIAPMYEKYFQDVLNVYTSKGWYQIDEKVKRNVKEKGVSFVCRTKNEADFLDKSLESLEGLNINHEIVIVMNNCTDHTEEVIDKHIEKGLSIKKFKYNIPISIPGIQHLATPENHPSSLISYYNYVFGKAQMSYIFRWDSDFILNEDMKEYLEKFDFEDTKNKAIKFSWKMPWVEEPNEEVYMTNALSYFRKDVFTQVMMYSGDSEVISTGIIGVPQDKENKPKEYWYEEPWFIGNNKIIEDKYNEIIEKEGKPHPEAFKASSPYYDLSLYKKCQIYLN